MPSTNGKQGTVEVEWTREDVEALQKALRGKHSQDDRCEGDCPAYAQCRAMPLGDDLPCELSDIDAGIDPLKPSGEGSVETFVCIGCGDSFYRPVRKSRARMGFCPSCAAINREHRKKFGDASPVERERTPTP